MLIIIKILTNKYTYIIAFVLAVIIFISILLLKIEFYKNETEVLHREVEDIKIKNTLLMKEHKFREEQIRLIETFSNSKKQIENIKIKDLDNEEKDTINIINTEFYNFMQHYQTNINATYKPTKTILPSRYNEQ